VIRLSSPHSSPYLWSFKALRAYQARLPGCIMVKMDRVVQAGKELMIESALACASLAYRNKAEGMVSLLNRISHSFLSSTSSRVTLTARLARFPISRRADLLVDPEEAEAFDSADDPTWRSSSASSIRNEGSNAADGTVSIAAKNWVFLAFGEALGNWGKPATLCSDLLRRGGKNANDSAVPPARWTRHHVNQ